MIDPEDYFDDINMSIHGVTEKDAFGASIDRNVFNEIRKRLEGTVSVCHAHFDRVSLANACGKYSLPLIQSNWLDSARVARRAREQCAWRGYGLSNVCRIIGFEFDHHNALEDLKAAGMIINAAINWIRFFGLGETRQSSHRPE